MKKYIAIGVLVFLLLMSISLLSYVNTKYQEQLELEKKMAFENQDPFAGVDFDELKKEMLLLTEWEDITEEDKITFAFGSTPEIIERVVNSLEKNRYVICYAVGGRMDKENKGTYFVMTGFNNEGKVKILSPQDNYEEKTYIFERVFENVDKILFFDNTEVSNNE